MRNMTAVNQSAFGALIQQFHRLGDLAVPEGIRYISTNDHEKDWLRMASFQERMDITPNLRMVSLDFDGGKYMLVIGAEMDCRDIDISIIREIDINAGILTLLIAERDVRLSKSISAIEFYDAILFQHIEVGYSGHDYNDLLSYVEPISIFAIPEYSVLKGNYLSRGACYLLTKHPSLLILNFDPIVLDLTSDLSLLGSDHISYRILLDYLFSTSYKHAFLEIYRLIERLFPISYIKELYAETGTGLSFINFVAMLEAKITWKPKEDDALERIFSSSREVTRQYFRDFLATSPDLLARSDHKYFYSLRNSIVHFRASHEDYELTNEQWNLLILATLYLLDEHYSLHNNILQN